MTERQDLWSFTVPWVFACIATQADFSWIGIAWYMVWGLAAVVIHGKITEAV